MLLLQERIDECKGALSLANVAFGAKRAEPKDVDTYGFKKDPKDFNVYWDVRKGLIPIVGGGKGDRCVTAPSFSCCSVNLEPLGQHILCTAAFADTFLLVHIHGKCCIEVEYQNPQQRTGPDGKLWLQHLLSLSCSELWC